MSGGGCQALLIGISLLGWLLVLVSTDGGGSAGATSTPRNLPCPTCGRANRLKEADLYNGRPFQCDECEQAEIAAIESDNYPSIHDDARDSIAAYQAERGEGQ